MQQKMKKRNCLNVENSNFPQGLNEGRLSGRWIIAFLIAREKKH
jgi:hypothetical protein